MFGGMFEVDRENSIVSMTGQGKGNMPLKTARCLEHALRVCRENEFQARGEGAPRDPCGARDKTDNAKASREQ